MNKKNKLLVRIFAGVMAALMLFSAVVSIFYIIFGNKNILQSNKSSFNDFYSYTKDEYSEFQTYIRIIEENDNFYLIEQTNKISTKGEKIDILLDKYSVYKEHFESCIIETNQQGDNLFAIYDVEKYINIFKTIKEK